MTENKDRSSSRRATALKRANRKIRNRAYLALFLLGVALSALTLIFTPLLSKLSLSQYGGYISENLIINHLNKIDSLRYEVEIWKYYNQNILDIIQGQKPTLEVDSLNNIDSKSINPKDFEVSSFEDILRKKSSASQGYEQKIELITYNFYPPLIGNVTKSFDSKDFEMVEISTTGMQNILAISDGSVIATYWSEDSGNTIQIQHADNIISTYKQLAMISKKVGDKVLAGESIGYIGTVPKETTEQNTNLQLNKLYFELWQDGNRVNPENYIVF